MVKNFFKSEAERNLWVKLNAEVIQYVNEILNHNFDKDLGDINKRFSPMWISNNQLIYDEHECDAPRFSFEELLMLTLQELHNLTISRNKKKIMKMFENL
jgi:hypothetical protein